MNRSDAFEALCLETAERYSMLRQGDLVVAGVSGGADSVAMLHFLCAIAPRYELRLVAAHLNHNLRGGESRRDAEFVAALCGRLGVALHSESADIADISRLRGQSVEECARDERYALFRRLAGPDGRIATAHTLNDSAETTLLNLARGTALRGLCGIPPVRKDNVSGATIIRPLIGRTRGEVEAYCTANGLDYVTDSSNLSDAYARNRLRHQAMPAMESVNPEFLRAISGATESLRADADFLDSLAANELTALERDGGYDASGLLALAEPIRRRALLMLLAEMSIPAERRRVELLEGLLRNGGRLRLSGDWYAACENGALLFLPATGQPEPDTVTPTQIRLPEPGKEVNLNLFSGKSLLIRCTTCKIFEETINYAGKQFKNALDCDRMNGIVSVRARLPGDSIRLAGRGCTKKLKKLYNEAGVPAARRERLIVLDDGGGPVWVEGFGPAERARVCQGTTRLLTLTVTED